jgi:CRISPR/Cas system-associated protein Csm6
MRSSVSFLAALCLLPWLFSASSCVVVAAGAAGAGAVYYVKGEFSATLDATPGQVVTASEKALKEMSISVLSSSSSSVDGKVSARTALDKKIAITVERESEQRSKIGIRVDAFGDEDLSRQIFEKIKSKL